MSRLRSNVGWIVWLQWVTATGAGWALGEAAASFISEDSVLLGTVHTAVIGVVLGTSEWLVLRGRIELAERWIVATAIGSGLGGAVVLAASFASGASVIQPWALFPLGVALGVCQWLIRRSQLARAGWWVLAVFGAISGALLIPLLRNGGIHASPITAGPPPALRRAHE